MADSVIGALRVNLGLDSARFMAGVRDAKNASGGLKAGLMAIGAVAASAAAGLAALGRSAIMSGAEIDRLARLSNATPAQFQKWASASKSVGIEQDKLADILKDVNDRVGDFNATGGGPMLDFFEQIAPKIGLTADAFKGLSGPDALQLYVSSLEKAGASQQDMTFFLEAMASDSTLLLPLLQNNGAAMSQLGDRAVELGAVMSNDMVAAMAQAKVSLTEVGTVMSGIGTQLGAAVAPALAALADAFVSLMMNGGALRGVIDLVAENLSRLATYAGTAAVGFGTYLAGAFVITTAATVSLSGALAFLRTALLRTGIGAAVVIAGELVYQFLKLTERAGGFGRSLSLLGDVAAAVWRGIVDSAKAIPAGLEGVWSLMRGGFLLSLSAMTTDFQNFIWKVSNAFSSAGFDEAAAKLTSVWKEADAVNLSLSKAGHTAIDEAGGKFAEAGGIISEAFGPARDAVAAMNAEVEETAAAATTATGGVTGLGAGIEAIGGGAGGGGAGGGKANKAKEALASLREELTRLSATFGMTETEARIWEEQRNAGVTAASAEGQEIAELVTGIEKLNEANDKVKDSTNGLGSAFSDMFRSLIDKSATAGEAIGNLAGKLADLFLDKGFGLLGDFFDSKKGQGGIWDLLGGFANGTPFAPGGLAMVGERGPELVNLPRGSAVMSNSATRGLLDGGGSAAVSITLSPELRGEILQEAGNQSIQITQAGLDANNRQLPEMVNKISLKPRERG